MLAVRLALLGVVLFYVVRALVAGFGEVEWAAFRVDAWWLLAGGVALLASVAAVGLATAANIRAMVPASRGAGVSPACPEGVPASHCRPEEPSTWPIDAGETPAPRECVPASSSSPLAVLVAAVAVARMGRYVPGKILTVAGVPLLLRPFGCNVVAVTAAVLLNSALNVLTGLLVAAPLLMLLPHVRAYVPAGWLWMVLIMAAMLALLHPAVNGPVFGFLFRKLRKSPPAGAMRVRDYVAPSLWLMVQWAAMGAGLWCVGRSVDGAFSLSQWWVCMSTAALAVTVGFLALFAPGGLGVREAIFLAVFAPLLGVEHASLLAVGMRVMTLVTEVLAAVVGAVVLRYARRAVT